jgi:hypothetical protein
LFIAGWCKFGYHNISSHLPSIYSNVDSHTTLPICVYLFVHHRK